MPTPGELTRNGIRVLRKEGPRAFGRAFALRFFDLQPVPPAFVPAETFDFSEADLEANRAVTSRFDARPAKLREVHWLVPVFSYPMAGINNIFHVMRHFREKHGVKNRILFYGQEQKGTDEVRGLLAAHYPEHADAEFIHLKTRADLDAVPPCDALVATRWDSCYPALKMNKTAAKYYLVQDHETMMYAAGTEQALASQTYRFGFARLCNTPSVYLATQPYGEPSMFFHQPVDARYNFAPSQPKPEGPVRIVFYGRPDNLRNGFGLGVEALRKVKRRFGDKVEILSMGSPWKEEEYGVEGVVKNLGVLDLTMLGETYRNAHVGLGLIFTTHPSLQPLEYWANGVAVVTNENPYNAWVFKDEENCLTSPPSVTMIAERVSRLVEDKALRERLSRAGLETMKLFSWNDSAERIHAFMTKRPMPAPAMP